MICTEPLALFGLQAMRPTLECNINMLLISLMDDTQPYRAEVRDRYVYSNFSYLHRSITVNLMMFLLTIYQTYSKDLAFLHIICNARLQGGDAHFTSFWVHSSSTAPLEKEPSEYRIET